MSTKIIKCEVFVGNSHYAYLLSKEEPKDGDIVLSKDGIGMIGRYHCLHADYPVTKFSKIIATSNPLSGHADFKVNLFALPQYVIEAYNSGAREFEIEMVELVTYGPRFKQGLLEVTYEKPKKQHFTRKEVIALIIGNFNITPAIAESVLKGRD